MGLSWKPGVSVRTHHYAAACIWTLVGLLLIGRGWLMLQTAQRLWLALPALALGCVKSLLFLDKTAGKNLSRLSAKRDGACLGGVYSGRMWAVVGMMVGVGWLLRHSSLPAEIVGCLYVAIGWALFFSSRLLWQRALRLSAAPMD